VTFVIAGRDADSLIQPKPLKRLANGACPPVMLSLFLRCLHFAIACWRRFLSFGLVASSFRPSLSLSPLTFERKRSLGGLPLSWILARQLLHSERHLAVQRGLESLSGRPNAKLGGVHCSLFEVRAHDEL
jgi:hypothetical protein